MRKVREKVGRKREIGREIESEMRREISEIGWET